MVQLKRKKEISKFSKKIVIIILSLFLFLNFLVIEKLDHNELIFSLIEDFCKSYKSKFRKNDFFYIQTLNSKDGEFYIFRLSSLDNKVILSPDGEAFYPVDYKTYDDKIFFIDGEMTHTPNSKVFDELKKYKLIDSTNYKLSLGLIQLKDLKLGDGTDLLDEKKKIVTYVVCKKTNKIISKWITNKSNVSDRKMKEAFSKDCN